MCATCLWWRAKQRKTRLTKVESKNDTWHGPEHTGRNLQQIRTLLLRRLLDEAGVTDVGNVLACNVSDVC